MAKYRYDDNTGKMLRLNEKTGKWVKDRKKVAKFDFDRPMNYVPDIGEFVAHATDKPVLIGSRSKLAAYERANGVRQCGDFKRGEIAERRARKVQREIAEVTKRAGVRPDNRVTWSDFR
jgi:hypothetical protein